MAIEKDPLVSIIMPVFNGEKYVAEAIDSVLSQSYEKWELIIVDDGSTDDSLAVINSFEDSRIFSLTQENAGVSNARNKGLQLMRGDFFCFLDSDDRYTRNSLRARLKVFESDSSIWFADGRVEKYNEDYSQILKVWLPDYEGNPLADLIKLSGNSFFGPSWMIRTIYENKYFFEESLTHCEDLFFYMNLARDRSRNYSFTDETVLHYRMHEGSAMQGGLGKLENCYKRIYNYIVDWDELTEESVNHFLRNVRLIMFKSYLRKGNLYKALKSLR